MDNQIKNDSYSGDRLNSLFIFNNFIVSRYNKPMVNKLVKLALSPDKGTTDKCILVYGKCGSGKTHLVVAFCNSIVDQSDKMVYYTTSATFISNFIMSVRQNEKNDFLERLKQNHVLVIEDIQYFYNKEQSQKILFELYDYFIANNKLIVFTSTILPKNINGFKERFISIMSGSFVMSVKTLGFSERIRYIQEKASHYQIQIPNEFVYIIAFSFKGDLRPINGVLNVLRTKGVEIIRYKHIKKAIKLFNM